MSFIFLEDRLLDINMALSLSNTFLLVAIYFMSLQMFCREQNCGDPKVMK